MKYTLVFSLFLFSIVLSAQKQQLLTKEQYRDKFSLVDSYPLGLTTSNYFINMGTEMGISEHTEMVLAQSTMGRNGYRHHRYKSTYKGLPVRGVSYNLHELAGHIVTSNGSYLPLLDLDIRPQLTAKDALTIAMIDLPAEKYSWENEHITGVCSKRHHKPVASLSIMDIGLPEFSGNYALCYYLELFSEEPHDGNAYYIDANSGEIIQKITMHHKQAVPGKGKTRYYGEQAFIVDSLAPSEYVLHDPTRGTDGISIYDDEMNSFTSESSCFDLANEDLDEVATDAHFCTSRFYDILRDEFDWLGIDNENGSMNVVVHARGGGDLVNAFWNGELASFGNGDCNRGPLTTLEVVGHEFMHGITDYTSDLVYRGESGAINESLSDVMGKLLEWKVDPDNFSWLLGHSILFNEQLDVFRDLKDPERLNKPSFYKGETWRDGSGVHTNSAIGNLFFVYLTDGAVGTNEAEEPFNVVSIGLDQAAKFIFHTNRFYLSEDSDYNAYYDASILAAEEFFGGDTEQIANIKEAWKAVGLPYDTPTDYYDLSIDSRNYQATCGAGEYERVELRIINEGQTPYLPASNGRVELEYTANGEPVTYSIELDEPLLPGEERLIEVDDYLKLEVGTVLLIQDLILADDNLDNNSAIATYDVKAHQASDLSLELEVDYADCFSDEYLFNLAIVNESCDIIQEGAEMDLFIYDAVTGEELLTLDLVLGRNLFTNSTFSLDTFGNLDITESRELSCYLDFAGDPDITNNEYLISAAKLKPITVDYQNGFDLSEFGDELLLTSINPQEVITSFAGESMFFTTGRFSNAFRPLCYFTERNWDREPGDFSGHVSARMDLCLDMEGQDELAVMFDMAQFRNDMLEFTSDLSSALRVSWLGGEAIINGETEGELNSYEIVLPSEYKGRLTFQFLTQTGSSQYENDYLDHDVIFFDNLHFDSVVATEEKAQLSTRLYPNPTTGRLFVSSSLQFRNYTLWDISGRLVQQGNIDAAQLDFVELVDGLYFIDLETDSGQVFRERVLVIAN